MATSSLLPAIAKRLQGKVALITGGTGGIGSVTAKLFCQHSAKVLIADIDDDKGHSICKDLPPESASYIHCDVTNESDVKSAIDKAMSLYNKLDIMFNNAGIVDPMVPDIVNYDQDTFERILRVNVVGTFLGTKHAARVMKPVRTGTIINTASVFSVIGGACPHAYTCSKHAILGLTRNTAVELGQYGIRVNCVSPYVVPTPMAWNALGLKEGDQLDGLYSNLKGVSLKPEDVAESAMYLASDESKYVSGHNLVVDGGYTIVNPGFLKFD